MEPYQNNDFPWRPYPEEPNTPPPPPKKEKKGLSVTLFAAILCVAVAASILLTYTLTANSERDYYNHQLLLQQEKIEELQQLLQSGEGDIFQKLEFLSMLFESTGYYADAVEDEVIIEAVLKAYAEATGDDYAAYYTEEEYMQMLQDSSGSGVGIGISIVNTSHAVDGTTYLTFDVIQIFKNSPAASSELQVGDLIYAIKQDGAYKTIEELGGYQAALAAMSGESGSVAEFSVMRPSGDGYQTLYLAVTRAAYVKESVSFFRSAADPTVGVVRIDEFDMTTPTQFKEAVDTLLSEGVAHFVFDVRQNPGGDLQSIKAVLSYLLEEGDLVLAAVDKDGNRVKSYCVEPQTLGGSYASCSVKQEEIGMYADLDMVVLCDGSTASAAEVFTASLRDHKNVPIIGVTTYGKGIMQAFYSLSLRSYGLYDGWLKLTTHAYVTECGVPYHGSGISPSVTVELDEAAKQYSIYTRPEALDNQLAAAIATVKQ